MTSYCKEKLGLFLITALLSACAAKPPNVESLPATADASAEFESTQRLLKEAKDENLDMLAPQNFERAEASLSEAQKSLNKGKSKEKVLENIAASRAWLAEAQKRAEIARTANKDLGEARSGAIRANAAEMYPKEFKKIESRARDITKEAEKGDVSELTKEGNKIAQEYHDLEIQSVTKHYLGDAQINVTAAKKDGAAKLSPKTLEATEAQVNATLALIKENPRNTAAIKKAAADATVQSRFLMIVNEKTKAGNTEELVLQSENQKHTISHLRQDYATTESQLRYKESELRSKESELRSKESELQSKEANLRQKDAVLKTAAELRSQLKPSEAEVFVENNAVKVRLKGVQFGSNQATINKKSASLLEKVDQVLGTVGVSAITVEGHTDALGSPEMNKAISAKRAEAVQDYMINKGKISSNQIKAIGMGEENPISDNKTSKGRAENRRIDLLIEPKVE